MGIGREADLEHIFPFLFVDIGFCRAMVKIPLGMNRNVVFRVAHLEQTVYRRRHVNPESYLTILFEGI